MLIIILELSIIPVLAPKNKMQVLKNEFYWKSLGKERPLLSLKVIWYGNTGVCIKWVIDDLKKIIFDMRD